MMIYISLLFVSLRVQGKNDEISLYVYSILRFFLEDDLRVFYFILFLF